MLDEEVLLKTNRNAGETMSVFYAVAAVCVPAFMLGGDSSWGVGTLIALGILAPINLYQSVSNWRTVRSGASWKFPLLLLPYIAMFIITVIAVLNPVVESVYVSGKEWARGRVGVCFGERMGEVVGQSGFGNRIRHFEPCLFDYVRIGNIVCGSLRNVHILCSHFEICI